MAKSFWGSLPFILVCFTGAGLVLSYEFARGNLSPRMLGIGLLALIGCLAVVVAVRRMKVGTSSQNEPHRSFEQSPRVTRSIRKLRMAVVALPIILIVGMWVTKGQPLIPRLTGAAVNLFFMFWFISVLRRAKKGNQ
jgi:small-conductance mechanosensitive channel